MTPTPSSSLYCIPHCTCGAGASCLRALAWPHSHALGAARAPGVDVPWITPRGGQNRRPGGAKKFWAPLHVRESKTVARSAASRRELTHWNTVFENSLAPLRVACESLTWRPVGRNTALHVVTLTDGTCIEWDAP